MTYHEKELDRIKHRISRACSTIFAVGLFAAIIGFVFAFFECWNGDPYSPVTYVAASVGTMLIYTAAYIGNQINRK